MMSNNDLQSIPSSSDIVIVGAGVSGLYSAWRLLSQDPSRKVVIVERLNRTGGRLDTDLIKIDGKTVRDEEGGMRFNYGMKELMALNGALDLCHKIVNFPMAPPSDAPNYNRYYVRGREFTYEDSAKNPSIWGEIYNLSEEEQGKTPVDLITEIYDKIVRANGEAPPANPTPEYWQRFRLDFKWDRTNLYEWQLWSLIRDMGYTEECITMMSHALGFEGPFLSLANAGEAFQILEDFPQNPVYYTFKDGFSTLPNALVQRVQDAGGSIHLSTNVETIENSEGGYCLKLTKAPEGQSSDRFVADGEVVEIKAKQVILAIASKALRNIYQSSPVFYENENAQVIWQNLESVVDMRLLKINLYFGESWWENSEYLDGTLSYGPSFTDLPANSLYPFYSLKSADNPNPTSPSNPAALTIYCDFNNTNFWQGLQNVGPLFNSPLQEQHTEEEPQVIFPTSQAIVDEAIKQISKVYKVKKPIPNPVMTSFRLWGGESDFGYAYHQWALNANDAEVMPALVEPVPGIFTCNEAYSDMQGWVNGSLRSTDQVLVKFGIQPLVDDPENMACQDPSTQ